MSLDKQLNDICSGMKEFLQEHPLRELKKQRRLNKRDPITGDTALLKALKFGDFQLAMRLIIAGANYKERDKNNKSLYDILYWKLKDSETRESFFSHIRSNKALLPKHFLKYLKMENLTEKMLSF